MAKKGVILPRRDGLVGEWLLNGNALDTASTNNGTATNVVYTTTYRGYQKQSGVFNGGSYVTITNNNEISDNDFSVSLWINPSSVSASTFFMFGLRDVSLSYSQGTNNRVRFNIYNAGDNVINYDSVALGTNVHIVATRSKTSGMKLYINGNLVGTNAYTGNGASISGTASIGQDSRSSSRFSGNIQSVRIFNRVLSQDEIQNWYLEGLRKLGGGSMSGLFDGVVAYYDMRGDANDIVGGNNGTVTGATLTTDRLGFANGAYSFNGTSDVITGSDAANLSPTATGVLTVIVWAKTSTYGGTLYRPLASKYVRNSTANSEWFLNPLNGQIVISGNGTNAVSGAATYNDSNWHMYVGVIRATGAKIYFDGNSIASGNLTLGNDTSTPIRIGGYGSPAANEYWNGSMGEVIVLNREPSANEVKAIYDLMKLDYLLPYL